MSDSHVRMDATQFLLVLGGGAKLSGGAMKACVAGVIDVIAAKLYFAGEAVSVVDLGPHLDAIRSKGLSLRWHDGTVLNAKVKAFHKAADAGEHDLIVLAVKAYDLEKIAETSRTCLGQKPW